MCEYHKGTEALDDADRLRAMLNNWLYRNCWCANPLDVIRIDNLRESLLGLLECYDTMEAQIEEYRADVREAFKIKAEV